jgi:hypothetical protein
MEIRLAKLFDNFPNETISVKFLGSLTIDQFNKFQDAIRTIEELHSMRRLRDFVVINNNDLIEMLNIGLQNLLSKTVSWNSVKRMDNETIFNNTNRLLLNYLSSIRTFIDHSDTFFYRKFGMKSENYLEFKKMLSFFFENSFAYRFFYKLRNYSQHVGIPLDSFHFTTIYDRDNNLIKGTIKVAFERDKLLENYDSWGLVKNDLLKLEQEFDVTPLIFEMTHNINEIERNIEIIYKKELLSAAHFITDLINHLVDNESEIFVAYNFKEDDSGELVNYSSLHIPFDTINFILKELN